MNSWVTIFDDVFAKSCRGEDMTVDELADLIKNTRAPKKSDLPLLKFARFGPLRTPTTPAGGGGSLRHDANVTITSGVEGDYDGEAMPFAEAVTCLEEAGIAFWPIPRLPSPPQPHAGGWSARLRQSRHRRCVRLWSTG